MKKQLAIIGGLVLVVSAILAVFEGNVTGQPNPLSNPFSSPTVVQAYQGTNATNEGVTYQGSVWTNYIAESTAYENDTPIDTQGYKDVALQFRFRCSAANTAAIGVMLGRSNDRVAGTTNIENFRYFTATAAGNATVTICTNLGPNNVWGAYRYLYVMYITNPAAGGGLTNYSIIANMK